MLAEERALFDLGCALRALEYRFVTVTPETHRRVNARPANATARSLRDVFGWSRPFSPELLPAGMLDRLRAAGALREADGQLASRVRFSTLGANLFVHSAYPTRDADAVFFGPDTYRYCALLARETEPAGTVVDVGCGSGAGGLVLAPLARRLVLADINPRALRHAAVNAALAGAAHAELAESDVLANVHGPVDLIVANPPYMMDPAARAYRDGGATFGAELSVRIVREALARLSPGGRLIVYTGAAIVNGRDVFLEAARPALAQAGAAFTYEELDPDVFGDELDQPGYANVDRIAAVALRAVAPR